MLHIFLFKKRGKKYVYFKMYAYKYAYFMHILHRLFVYTFFNERISFLASLHLFN